MDNYLKLSETIKQITVNSVNNLKLSDVLFGKVISTNPLKVEITQDLILSELQLIVPKKFTDYKVETVIDGQKKEIEVKNKLKNNESVILLRALGGQSYVILDRVGD